MSGHFDEEDEGDMAAVGRVMAEQRKERHAGWKQQNFDLIKASGITHKVTNNGLEPAVSLHVYSPALVEMNRYEPQGDVLHLIESQLVGVDW